MLTRSRLIFTYTKCSSYVLTVHMLWTANKLVDNIHSYKSYLHHQGTQCYVYWVPWCTIEFARETLSRPCIFNFLNRNWEYAAEMLWLYSSIIKEYSPDVYLIPLICHFTPIYIHHIQFQRNRNTHSNVLTSYSLLLFKHSNS